MLEEAGVTHLRHPCHEKYLLTVARNTADRVCLSVDPTTCLSFSSSLFIFPFLHPEGEHSVLLIHVQVICVNSGANMIYLSSLQENELQIKKSLI